MTQFRGEDAEEEQATRDGARLPGGQAGEEESVTTA